MATRVGVLPSEARTADKTSPLIVNWKNHDALHCVVDVTAGSAFNLVFTIKGKDTLSGKSYTLLASNIINATGTTVLRVAPELTGSTGLIAKDYLPYEWYVDVTQSGSISTTYSVGASMI
jgi:hypothetical protein